MAIVGRAIHSTMPCAACGYSACLMQACGRIASGAVDYAALAVCGTGRMSLWGGLQVTFLAGGAEKSVPEIL
jgi:hypothetical protein